MRLVPLMRLVRLVGAALVRLGPAPLVRLGPAALRRLGSAVRLGPAALVWTWLSLVPAAATADPDLRLPPGTRADPQGVLISGRGLRETTDFFARQLAGRGISARQIGPYRVRGVELTRFVSETRSTPWLAVHVLRSAGKTLIFFVPRPKA